MVSSPNTKEPLFPYPIILPKALIVNQKKQFHQFLFYASGSCSEVASMTYLGKRIKVIQAEDANQVLSLSLEISKIIGGLLKCTK